MSLDLSTLKVGDKVRLVDEWRPDRWPVREVTAVGRQTFLYQGWKSEIQAQQPELWEKVEPPLIDPEHVYAVSTRSGDMYSTVVNKWDGTSPLVRITAYELVEP